MGPFQKTVLASARAAAKATRVSGPMSRPIRSAGIASMATTVVGGVCAERGGGDDVGGEQQLDALLGRGLGEEAAHGVELVGLEQARADLVALGGEEGVGHASTDEQPVDGAQQVGDDPELVGDLGAAEDDDVGPGRVVREAAQHVSLGGDRVHRRSAGAAAGTSKTLACLRCTAPKPSPT